jgi:hypothetical protein
MLEVFDPGLLLFALAGVPYEALIGTACHRLMTAGPPVPLAMTTEAAPSRPLDRKAASGPVLS